MLHLKGLSPEIKKKQTLALHIMVPNCCLLYSNLLSIHYNVLHKFNTFILISYKKNSFKKREEIYDCKIKHEIREFFMSVL